MELSQQLSIPITFDDRIKEIHFGDWEGSTASEIMEKTPDDLKRFWSNPDKYPPPLGEPLAQFHKRVIAAWNMIISEYHGKRVLIVTHGGVIRILLCHVLEIPLTQMLELEVKLGKLHSVQINSNGESCIMSETNIGTEDV
jgi:broad specificity phosphatase PhoE